MKTVHEVIVLGRISGTSKQSMWSELVSNAEAYRSSIDIAAIDGEAIRAGFEEYLHEGEEKYMVEYCIAEPDMWVTRKGKNVLNKRKHLPAAYRTAKSVACNMLQNGLSFRDNVANVLGKSACEKVIKQATTTRQRGTAYSEAFDAIHKARRAVINGTIDDVERDILLEDTNKLLEVIRESA